MKAIIQKQSEVIRNVSKKIGESNEYYQINSRIITMRLFGIPIFRKIESFSD